MKKNTSHHDAIQKLSELIRGIEFAMLTTIEENGYLRSRPMATQHHTFDGELWFFTRLDTPKVTEASRESHVGVSYADHKAQCYVSISGRAEVIRDQVKTQELWNPLYKAWFPEGLEDPNLGLIKVTVDHAEYWDAPSSRMVQVVGFLKASVTGKEYKPGENKKLDLTG